MPTTPATTTHAAMSHAAMSRSAQSTSVYLHGVRFETFERLAAEMQNPGKRLAYGDGTLEIMTPSSHHEAGKTHVARLIEAMTEEFDIKDINEAFAHLEAGKARYRVVLKL